MLHIILYQPEIPGNTGNIIRLCANIGCQLHLIRPLGFQFTHEKLKRAGLDYHDMANVTIHDELKLTQFNRLFAITTQGKTRYTQVQFKQHDALLFGSETKGLPDYIKNALRDQLLRLPMQPNSRSLNLSNAVAITAFEAWKQMNFINGL
ncbi:MAG: tRNA (cytidine(34)-2'-O)-methyltransferase [Endozoicomonadaceae bacterium]|nr:tRNA (cytidine(34)-2'-O)-methyltransferase [Endozoicomonadaceae bacterium]